MYNPFPSLYIKEPHPPKANPSPETVVIFISIIKHDYACHN